MDKIEYRPWVGGVDETAASSNGFLSTIGPTVDATLLASSFDETDALIRLAWTLRRQLWRDFLANDCGRIEFSHSCAQGFGTGPDLVLQSSDEASPRLALNAEFLYSDMLYTLGGLENPLRWGWSEFIPRNVEWRDVEPADDYSDVPFEFSFDSRDVLDLDASRAAPLAPWCDVDRELQMAIVTALLARLVPGEAETTDHVSGEDIFDILCMISEVPGTTEKVLELMAIHSDPWVRRALGYGACTPAEVLVALSSDSDVATRRGVSRNPSAPESARAQAFLLGT